MNYQSKPPAASPVREDFVPADAYISPDFAKAEKQKLWPYVWQWACREEEIPNAGDYVTYEVCDESITVVRKQDGTIAAYHNVCPHRGRKLTSGCGRMGRFHCKFHGWQWDLDGRPVAVVDRQDWGDRMPDEEIMLAPVKVGSWGGWVFVNMDPEAESLDEFLEPAKAVLDPYEFEKMRYKWRKRVRMDCNWKVALEAFNEGYHVQTTHRQLLPNFDDRTYSKVYGKHGMFGAPADALFGLSSPRLGGPEGDLRTGLYEFNREVWETLRATTTPEIMEAGRRLSGLPENTPIAEIYGAFMRFHREELEKNGIGSPDVTPEQVMAVGIDWHIFPNMVFLPQPTNLLGYRARPDGENPDRCIFEVYVLERFAEGQVPKAEVESADDWRDVDWGLILTQDFQNMSEVQAGMRSRGFKGARTNPVQEKAVSNFHDTLWQYVHADR
jgi:phenylpropionate dioxygenase-like ring-hydroxylating dioxygenase large terminal subunit